MKRNSIHVLQKWKSENERTPFYLTGIKGVGKTYLAYDFVNDFFDSCLYLNFEHNNELVLKFEALTEADVIPALSDYFAVPEELLYTTPFIFDEIKCLMNEKNYTPPTIFEKIDIALEHIRMLCNEKGEETGIREARKHIGHYTKGLKSSASARQRLNFAISYEDIYNILSSLAKENE